MIAWSTRHKKPAATISLSQRFGIRSLAQLRHDYGEVLRDGLSGRRFQFDLQSCGLIRPDLSIPTYAGAIPTDGLAPIYNLFDRTGGGKGYSQRVGRRGCRDFRGGKLSYDEHDGTDFVCPIGTELCAAAPGIVVMHRQRWLRGGLTVAVDHGAGLVTQYSHCSRPLAEIGQPVRRGQPVALSGASGVDLVSFFPWVPPHIHFLVMLRGRAIDPFCRPDESPGLGSWLHERRLPQPGMSTDEPPPPQSSAVDHAALEYAATTCTDPTIRREISRLSNDPPALAALLEDALMHDRWAWPAILSLITVRPTAQSPANPLRLTLPLPRQNYRGSRFADAPWTLPPH